MRLDDYDDFLDQDFDTELNELFTYLQINFKEKNNKQIEIYKPIDNTPYMVVIYFNIFINIFLKNNLKFRFDI